LAKRPKSLTTSEPMTPEARYSQALEATSYQEMGGLLQRMRGAAQLKGADIGRHGPVTTGGLWKWEKGERGVAPFHYALTLAKISRGAQAELLAAAGFDAARPRPGDDPELKQLIDGIEEAWMDIDRRPAIRLILEGIMKLPKKAGLEIRS
jgi:hypothetical protein